MPTTERVIQNHLQKKTIRLGERQCAYIDMGQQQADRGSVPLIFIHGWCQSLEYWSDQLLALSKNHRVIAYDLRGMGDTEGALRRYSMSDWVQDLYEFQTALGVESAILIAHSLGGFIATQYAATHPQMVRGLCVSATPSDPMSRTDILTYRLMAGAVSVLRHLGVQNAPALFWQPIERRWWPKEFVQRKPGVVAQTKAKFLQVHPTQMMWSLEAMSRQQDLPVLQHPVLAVYAELDPAAPPSKAGGMLDKFNNHRKVVMDNIGHMLCHEASQSFTCILQDNLGFLMGQGRPNS